MTTATWPSTIPQCPILNGFNERPQPNVASFTPEVGPPKMRRRSTAKGWLTNMTFRFTNAQMVTFLTFYETTLKDGSLPFTMNHPRTTTNYSWMFMPGDEPEIVRTAPNASTVAFRLVRLPP
jgi:hypothetical protein